MLPAFILSGQITLAEKANLAKKELGSTEDFFAYSAFFAYSLSSQDLN